MSFLVACIILAAQPAAPMDDRYAEAIEIYRCDFDASSDANFDGWPDDWSRRRGRAFPPYVKIAIQRQTGEDAASRDGALRIDMDGGAAAVYSAPVEISPLFSYVLEGKLRTENLKHDVAYLEVVLYDAEGKPLETHTSPRVRDLEQWREIRVGPIAPTNQEVRSAVIGLHVRPTDHADLTGSVLFEHIWLGRLPRITLSTSRDHNLYAGLDEVEITCQISGLSDPNPLMEFELLDVRGHQATVFQRRLKDDAEPSSGPPLVPAQLQARSNSYVGIVAWKPTLPDYGFYEARVRVQDRSGVMLQKSLNLAAVRSQSSPIHGQFGWSLPNGEDPLPLKSLVSLLSQVGVNWAKFPVWYSENDRQAADRLAWFAERLSNYGVELVGVLDRPPGDARELFGEKHSLSVASVFLEPELWQPIVDPVMIRLSLKVRWWQLGADDDVSFVDFPDLREKIYEIRRHLEQFGQRIRLGISWGWLSETPRTEAPSWDYLSYTVDPPLTSKELRTHLEAEPAQTAQRWVVLQPLAKSRYSTDTRARDLVTRMLEATMHGAEGVFLPEPFSGEHGLMTEAGAPAELLLPWRTTALLISGSDYLGAIRLPQGSSNHVFVRDGEAVMAVWSDTPVTETIYLGENVRQVDLWGRESTPLQSQEDGQVQQIIEVGTLPTFLIGANPAIARWRMSFAFDKQQLSNVFGQQQTATYHFQNFFDRPVSGDLALQAPKVWDTQHGRAQFKLAAGEKRNEAFQVLLRSDASTGPQPVRIQFDITADRRYQFNVYRTIQVGLGDIMIEMSTQLSDSGDLVVEQQLLNHTDEFVSFNCQLFAPNRQRERVQVYNVGRGRATNQFVLPRGKELVGQTIWLRAEEIGGARILNYRMVATP